MVKEEKVWHTYKKNVPFYNLGIRRFRGDNDGVMLTNEFPTFRVEEDDHREFKMANKKHILEGKIALVPEESLEWEVSNAVTDEEADELLKNYAKLKSSLTNINSPAIVQKILARAEEQGKPKGTLSLIKNRLGEITPDEKDFIYREDMQATYDDTRLSDGE